MQIIRLRMCLAKVEGKRKEGRENKREIIRKNVERRDQVKRRDNFPFLFSDKESNKKGKFLPFLFFPY